MDPLPHLSRTYVLAFQVDNSWKISQVILSLSLLLSNIVFIVSFNNISKPLNYNQKN